MKFRMILTALLLPCVVGAQQAPVKLPAEKSAPETSRLVLTQTPKPTTEPSVDSSSSPFLLAMPSQLTLPPQYIPAAILDTLPDQTQLRVNLNLRNAPLTEAIKQLTGQTKEEFVLENDVPADARVTAVAKNIRLTTALDMLTDATGLNWNRQTVRKTSTKEAGVVFHLGKKVSRNSIQWSSSSPVYNMFPSDGTNYRWNLKGSDLKLKYKAAPNAAPGSQTPSTLPYLLNPPKLDLKYNQRTTPNLLTPQLPLFEGTTRLLQTSPSDNSVAYSLGNLSNTFVSTVEVKEVRSTFTCPHCKQQVTVIHKHESPKCEKCGRVFHDDWQFCPFDGAKRPAGADSDWQFCPLCGKSIKADGKADVKPGN